MGNPVLSVVLPAFRARHIGWLALESLCRQEDINFSWELIVREEIHDNAMGLGEVKVFSNRLEKVGCCNFKYMGIGRWETLGSKVYALVNSCSKSVKAISFIAADSYAPPRRLTTQYKALQENPGMHWFCTRNAYYYNINNGNLALWRSPKSNRPRPDAVGRFLPVHVAKKIKYVVRRSSIDRYVWDCVANSVGGENKIKVVYDNTDNWKFTLNTTGLNNITHNRAQLVDTYTPPWERTSLSLEQIVPQEVADMLVNCRRYVSSHNKARPDVK